MIIEHAYDMYSLHTWNTMLINHTVDFNVLKALHVSVCASVAA